MIAALCVLTLDVDTQTHKCDKIVQNRICPCTTYEYKCLRLLDCFNVTFLVVTLQFCEMFPLGTWSLMVPFLITACESSIISTFKILIKVKHKFNLSKIYALSIRTILSGAGVCLSMLHLTLFSNDTASPDRASSDLSRLFSIRGWSRWAPHFPLEALQGGLSWADGAPSSGLRSRESSGKSGRRPRRGQAGGLPPTLDGGQPGACPHPQLPPQVLGLLSLNIEAEHRCQWNRPQGSREPG